MTHTLVDPAPAHQMDPVGPEWRGFAAAPTASGVLGGASEWVGIGHVAVDGRASDRRGQLARPTALTAPCACPAFCERDHANE